MKCSIVEEKHELTIEMDTAHIIDSINDLKKKYQPDYYTPTFGLPEDEPYMTKEKYEQAYDELINFVKSITEEDLLSYLKSQSRKKNGTFNRRNSVHTLCYCNASTYISEWHNTWIYYELRTQVISDTKMIVTIFCKTDTPA